jgi:hypothetical protein
MTHPTLSVLEERTGLVRWAVVDGSGARLSHGDVLVALRDSAPFRRELSERLRATPFAALFFETPAITRASAGRPFECVALAAPALAATEADPTAFAAHVHADGDAIAFENLGGDATLVVPTERGERAAYAHLVRFLRGAPEAQVSSLWRLVGEAALARLGERPLWLSTAGLGVPWLHVRLDSRPKYYRHAPYRHPPA